MKTNEQVIRAWTKGQPAKANNLWTDGENLYSYSLVIGENKGGESIVFDYTSRGGAYHNQTTSTHVGIAALHADQLMNVDEAMQVLFTGGR
tara:strand:+ start:3108 stop:3380 length:273 start_codon:yes stop_codon:yes gene_type:complete